MLSSASDHEMSGEDEDADPHLRGGLLAVNGRSFAEASRSNAATARERPQRSAADRATAASALVVAEAFNSSGSESDSDADGSDEPDTVASPAGEVTGTASACSCVS